MSEEYINSLSELKNIKKKDIYVFLLIFLFVIFFDNLLIAHKFEFVSILVVISIPFMWNTYSKINKYKEKQHDSDIRNILDEEFYDKAIERFKYIIQIPFIIMILLIIIYLSNLDHLINYITDYDYLIFSLSNQFLIKSLGFFHIGNFSSILILTTWFYSVLITSLSICYIIYIPQIYKVLVEERSRKKLKEYLTNVDMKYKKFKKIYEELFDNNYTFNKEEFHINDEFLSTTFINHIKVYLQKKENIDAYSLFNLIDFDNRNQYFVNTSTKESLELYKYIEEKKESLKNYQFIQGEIEDYLYNSIIYSIEENPRMFYYISKNFKEFISKNFDSDKYEQYKKNNTYQIRLLDFFLNNIFKIYLNNKVKTEYKIKFKKNITRFWGIDIKEIEENKMISDYIVKKYLNYIMDYIVNNNSTKGYIIDDFTNIIFPKVRKQVFLTILLFNKLIQIKDLKIKELLKKKWIFSHSEYFTDGTKEYTYEFIRLLNNHDIFKKSYIEDMKKILEDFKKENKKLEDIQIDHMNIILKYYNEYLSYLKNREKDKNEKTQK